MGVGDTVAALSGGLPVRGVRANAAAGGCPGCAGRPAAGGAAIAVDRLVRDAAALLRDAGVDTPEHDAKLLLAEACGVELRDVDKALLMRDDIGRLVRDGRVSGGDAVRGAGGDAVSRPSDDASRSDAAPSGGAVDPIAEAVAAFGRMVDRRAAREPLQYIVGHAPFRYLDLAVGPGVFIPRPETETVVQAGLDWLEGRRSVAGASSGGATGDSSSYVSSDGSRGAAPGGSPDGLRDGSTGDASTGSAAGVRDASGGSATGVSSRSLTGIMSDESSVDSPSGVAVDVSDGSVGRRRFRVVDLCAGSGAVGLSLAGETPDCEVWAVELSERTAAWTSRNAMAVLGPDAVTVPSLGAAAEDGSDDAAVLGLGSVTVPSLGIAAEDGSDAGAMPDLDAAVVLGSGAVTISSPGVMAEDGSDDAVVLGSDMVTASDLGVAVEDDSDVAAQGDSDATADLDAATASEAGPSLPANDTLCMGSAADRPYYHLVLGDATAPDTLADLDGTVDLVVTNPPYVPESEIPEQPEVRDHDPSLALYGGSPDGLLIPERIIDRAARLLRPGGALVMEHDISQGDALVAYAQAHGFAEAHTGDDLTGRPRYLFATR